MKVLLISLGCDKNLVDSEVMLGLLNKAGHELTNDETEAEAVVINTCAFISDAKEESINTIIEMGRLKKTGRLKKLIVAGCLSQRYKDEIMKELPEIDVIIGATNYDKIVEAIGTDEDAIVDDINYTPKPVSERIVTTNASMAYFKIAEGCNKLCTYCIIPHIRGRYRSIPMDRLLASAEKLAADGIKELVLVAQETTIYGVDLYGGKKLPELLTKLSDIEGIEWIRLLYCYPEEITDELISVMAENPKICHYIDIPIQHSENEILRRMGRKTSREDIVSLVSKLRTAMPDIAIRTTLISGFPGETQKLHDGLVDFVDECEFDRLGVFTYSPEEGTPAAGYEDQVDGEIAAKWRDEIMELQQEISYEKNQELIGSIQRVLIEGYLVEDDVYVGRTYRDAPGVDGIVFVSAPYELMSGSFVDVKITEANEYDLTGVIVE
ncbi:30S ribosomal protein S12 methylthiotransferase RimO [Coprococcus eutactus]|uniref:30S ribosomal protein S12 methylthiotransferase RimO n=1 Tax=Coprococcus eutactus TaxID=33043 RepID=UPI001C02E467|nr:30S ribosomal protein S12 methylthiotransferase RimO [Coprococcus eutactus]MBT9755000.1 30S ribosomal protein S12 methylthiotransferase RimO [Coprococcus eutactus]